MSIRILPVFSPSFPARLSHFTSCSVGCSYRPHPPPGKLNSKAGKLRSFCAVKDSDSEAAAAATTATEDWSARWVLEPVGNGDFRHIGYRIPRPGAIELASDVVVTIGRTPEKADAVVAVPTVSGLHARIETTEQNLSITDLDSTNGTFIDEKRLQPGVAYAASNGNLVTFGDTNLAIFRVCKVEKEDQPSPEGSSSE